MKNKDLKFELEDLRKGINNIDNEILELLKKRAELVRNVGELKNEKDSLIYIPEREKQIFERLKKGNHTGIPDSSIISIYTEIISACRNLEKPMTVSYLGPEASFTHSAAIKQFGSSVKFIPQNSIDSIFYNVERNYSDYGVVPIENSTEGTVNYTLDRLVDSDLKIVAELSLKISHSFCSNAKDFNEIKKVYSHPQSFGQCKNWIINNIKNLDLIEVNSNSYAAQLAAKEKDAAAICPKIAAVKYGVNLVEEAIEDFESNTTRFLVVGQNLNNPSGFDKTSIMFSPKEKVGVLYDALQFFYENDINLTMIESRPNKQIPWQYIFFLDMIGHHEDEKLKKALEGVKGISTQFKILGSYPKRD